MDYLIILLAAAGLTYAVQAGKLWFITEPVSTIPFFASMFSCSLCLGTQCGWWLYLATHFTDLSWRHLPFVFCFGLASGIFTLIILSLEKIIPGSE